MNPLVSKLATLSDDLDHNMDAVRETQSSSRIEWPWVRHLESVQRRLEKITAAVDGLEIRADFPP